MKLPPHWMETKTNPKSRCPSAPQATTHPHPRTQEQLQEREAAGPSVDGGILSGLATRTTPHAGVAEIRRTRLILVREQPLRALANKSDREYQLDE